MRIFALYCYLVFSLETLKIFMLSRAKSDAKMNNGNYFWEMVFFSSFTTRSSSFSEFNGRNTIFSQIKVFDKKNERNYATKVFHKSNCAP